MSKARKDLTDTNFGVADAGRVGTLVAMRAAIRHRWGTRLTVVTLLVAAADFLFFDHTLGCTAAIYTVMLLAATVFVGAGMPRQRSVVALSLAVLAVAVAMFLEPTRLSMFMGALGLTTLALTQRHGWTGDVVLWFRRVFSLWRRAFTQWARDLRVSVSHCDESGVPRIVGVRRWLPALGLGVVFLALFAMANPVLADWLGSAARRVFHLGDLVDARRVLFWIGVAMGAWALLRTRATNMRSAELIDVPSPISSMTLVRSLWVFNLLFLLQNGLDIRHLLLDAALPANVTYSDYARRGAYPLLAAALLSAGFVLTAFRSKEHEFGAGPRRLVYLFLTQNVVLTAFAMARLTHYVEAYSLSRMRVAAFLWMGLVAIGLALIFVRILAQRTNRWLLGANAIATAVLLFVCCFVNVDRMIADFNVQRCREVRGHGQPIDLEYLKTLGVDALPALRRLQSEATEATTQMVAGVMADGAQATLDLQMSDWRGWTLRRQQLRGTYTPSR